MLATTAATKHQAATAATSLKAATAATSTMYSCIVHTLHLLSKRFRYLIKYLISIQRATPCVKPPFFPSLPEKCAAPLSVVIKILFGK